ncbi:diadenylate cyclase CdaA [Floricoccus penangensis]|uniref:Diadenylate cyclase n=1 Tax=Floricoccus penangensis TaxID=1859475 RepID=A0A9Q5JGT4_9LACT|nr:diadenylate cyclase CdaA [Floricoccus penangensis]OFI46692.1 TIGR00159 family protein [Floricoccus penangensis]URZ86758.1 diadenylate cyclase CdaA [Floricoccus penangensis]
MNDINQIFNPQFWSEIIQLNLTPWRLFISIVDIAVVTYFIYRIMRYVQGSKVVTLVRGVLLFVLIRIISEILGLTTVTWLLNQVITYGVIAGVIIFQPEIRRALEQLGRTTNILRPAVKRVDSKDYVQAYEKALDYMAKRKIGALISIAKTQSLEEFSNTGIPLNSDISAELLINIFIPNTPLHDGAVIVEGNKIISACAYLPLTDKSSIPKAFGTRHRAAIGMSEATDALTLVVSEETGGISITKNGEFYSEVSKEKLHEVLTLELGEKTEEKDSFLEKIKKGWLKK